jgi:glycosyltransferase involved in cell wall biosynthesis
MDSSTQPLVSIVTPMYNEEARIAECIESVLAQTYQDWEYVIVDNCSTDGSAAIANRYAEDDSRIRVVQNVELLNAIPNHNASLRRISPESKYCKVVFADDLILPECVARMVAVAEAHPSIGVVGAYGIEGQQVVWTGLPYPETFFSGREICRRLFLDGLYVFGTATSLLYRADLVRRRDPFFDPSNIHSDMETCVILLKDSDFGFVHQVLTFTRVREGSRITQSRRVNTLEASKLNQLVTHGPFFLSSEELDRCLSESVSDYYWNLAGSFVRGRDKSFWQFHKHALEAAGVGFSRGRLARNVAARLGAATLNLEDSFRQVRRARANKGENLYSDE